MATNLHIDDRLVEKAVQLGGHKSKREAVTHALEDYVRRLEQLKIIDAFGTFDFDPTYNYKRQRQRK
jgi:hypothetical protein